MNKRILELAIQSGFYIDHNKIYNAVFGDDITKCQEKFAELIVQECISTMGSEIVYNDNYKEKNKTISDMMELLKQHLGI